MSESTIANRWQAVQERVAQAAIADGRSPSEVLIIGVTKYVDAQAARELFQAGCHHWPRVVHRLCGRRPLSFPTSMSNGTLSVICSEIKCDELSPSRGVSTRSIPSDWHSN